jgi:D-3-phosphoglycerate dehydrogenase
VSIHLPVNENTKGMIGRELLNRMQSHAIFVNTSRAAVVKRNDLLEVIRNHKIKGAVLDVFDNEPPDDVDYELIRMGNVLATPHISGATHEVEDHHVKILNKKLIEHFSKAKN